MPQTKEDKLIAESYNKVIAEIAELTPSERRTPEQQFQLAKELVTRIVEIKSKHVSDSIAIRTAFDILKNKVNNWNRLVEFCNAMGVFERKVNKQDIIDMTEEGITHAMQDLPPEAEDAEDATNGYFHVSALVPVGDRQEVKRMDGRVNMPQDTNRTRVLGTFISRYTNNVGLWVKRNERTNVVRWVAPKPPQSETQQEFSF